MQPDNPKGDFGQLPGAGSSPLPPNFAPPRHPYADPSMPRPVFYHAPPGYPMTLIKPYPQMQGYPVMQQPPPPPPFYKIGSPSMRMMNPQMPVYPTHYAQAAFPPFIPFHPDMKFVGQRVGPYPPLYPMPPPPPVQPEEQEDSEVESRVLNSGLEFSNVSDEEAERMVVLLNLCVDVTEDDVRGASQEFGEVERVMMVSPKKDKRVAVVVFRDKALVARLFASHPRFKDNPRVARFSQELIRQILNEQTEMISKAIERFSKPENFAHLLNFGGNFSLYVHHLLSKRPLSFFAHSIRVREIWIGNLPAQTSEQSLLHVLGAYGPVDNVDMFTKNQNFAFVRFTQADAAKRCVDAQSDIMKVFNCQIRMSYSDFLKRFNIVGDDPAVADNDAQLTNVIFVSFNTGTTLPSLETLREKFADFGKIKNALFRPTMNEQLRPFVLVEMETREQVKRVRKFFAADDRDGRRKLRLGDKKVEVNVLLKPNVTGNLQELMLRFLQLSGEETNLEDMAFPAEASAARPMQGAVADPDNLFWTGMLQVQGKKQIGIDAWGLSTRERELLHDRCFYININRRLLLSDLQVGEPFAMCLLRVSDTVHAAAFTELREQFERRQECGIVLSLAQSVGVVLPAGEKCKEICPSVTVPADALLMLFYPEDVKLAGPNVTFL